MAVIGSDADMSGVSTVRGRWPAGPTMRIVDPTTRVVRLTTCMVRLTTGVRGKNETNASEADYLAGTYWTSWRKCMKAHILQDKVALWPIDIREMSGIIRVPLTGR